MVAKSAESDLTTWCLARNVLGTRARGGRGETAHRSSSQRSRTPLVPRPAQAKLRVAGRDGRSCDQDALAGALLDNFKARPLEKARVPGASWHGRRWPVMRHGE